MKLLRWLTPIGAPMMQVSQAQRQPLEGGSTSRYTVVADVLSMGRGVCWMSRPASKMRADQRWAWGAERPPQMAQGVLQRA
ncbi:MAG: hypothetical protein A2W72_04915 [Burkholderiales bacterium RIFCSPLOWO2_12_67_14]|nr:MAG: hypothetical protein A3I64_17705 [Burkholderiales bacterium RIFCSPLOWO2_02_FULL_67_64]OGB41063.1 MAG: hypothetical protein A2W72_04915 [Burkholderiales bacterium RIFCSPLOWO2_12_67_14]OGB47345.1 MAG: hypothetical protein A3E51_11555 [Burkholderiales bacterium RIFCSPHIGHO2_12_FULL_67_38]